MLSIFKIIIVVGISFILLMGCADENPATETTYQDCTVVRKDSSVVKIIQPSSILSNNLTASNVCEIVQSFTDKQFNQTLKSISTLCEPVDKLVQETSNGDYKEAYDKLLLEEISGSEKLLNLILSCSSQSNRITVATIELLHSNIYSFGTFVTNGKECPGFLSQMTVLNEAKENINEQVYFLYGYDKCGGFELDYIDNPIEKPNSILPGDKLRNSFKYNGLLPDKWIHNNRTYKYYTIESKKPSNNNTVKSEELENSEKNKASIIEKPNKEYSNETSIEPGVSLGSIYIGQSKTTVSNNKEIARYLASRQVIVRYLSDDKVSEIMTYSPDFQTKQKVDIQSRVKFFQDIYPNSHHLCTEDRSAGSISTSEIFDDINSGIALIIDTHFGKTKESLTTITIHRPGTPVSVFSDVVDCKLIK